MVGREGKPIEIITVNGRGKQPVIGYVEGCDTPYSWCCTGMYSKSVTEDPWDLFFALKVEVVHVFKRNPIDGFILVNEKKDIEFWMNQPDYTHLGTITGPIVPPEKSEVVK